MAKKKSPFLLALFILSTLFIAASLVPSVAPSTTSPPGQAQPERDLASPANQIVNGYPMNLTESVNGWQSRALNPHNSFAIYHYRNDSFSEATPDGYSKVWQNIIVSNLQASNDTREIQGGTPLNSLDFIACGTAATLRYPELAMNFTPPDTVNLTIVSLYYGAVSGPANIPLYIVTDSGSGTPSLTALGSGTLSGSVGDNWHNVTVSTSSGRPITLSGGTNYWIVMDGSSLSANKYYKWFYVTDPTNPSYDSRHACYYDSDSDAWKQENSLGVPFNFLTVVRVLPVGSDRKAMQYNSPAKVGMYLNATIQITDTVTRVPIAYRSFLISTNTSVTFTVNWTARFEFSQPNAVSTHYIAREGFTLWNASFTTGSKPGNPYNWYNLTFKVTTIPQYWSGASPPTNVTSTPRNYSSTFAAGASYYIITQTNGTNLPNWSPENWTIIAKSAYRITASLPSQVVAGLPLTVTVTTAPYSNSWCNISFFDLTGDIEYTRNATITGSSYQLTLKLNRSDSYTLFLFDRWTLGNEASLNKTLSVTILKPLCNVTVDSVDTPILGNPATARFRFLNGTSGWSAMPPITVMINGTITLFNYAGGVTTVSWNTTYGGWRSGSKHVNITTMSGVFFNYTVVPITIIQPRAALILNATSFSAVYGDVVPIGFKFVNTTTSGVGNAPPLPPPDFLYLNGSQTSYITRGGWCVCNLTVSGPMFYSAGTYDLNFTAVYRGLYIGVNTTSSIIVSLTPMVIKIHLDQTAVTVGSSLSVSADLTYGRSGAPAEDGTPIVFRFNVTYVNGTAKLFDKTVLTLNGIGSSSLTTTGDMREVSVQAIFASDGIRASARDAMLHITVVQPSGGFPVILLVGASGVGALLVILAVLVAKTRSKGKAEEAKKEARFAEAASLAQLVVWDNSGTAVFSRKFGTDETVDPQLISGFMRANDSLMKEVFKGGKATLKSADYGDYKVVSERGEHIWAALFCTETAGQEIKSALVEFVQRFEDKFGKALPTWDGNTNAFKDADRIFDKVFTLPLTYPHSIAKEKLAESKLGKNEEKFIKKAKRLSAGRGFFFMPKMIDYLINEQKMSRGKTMDLIDSLVSKGVLRQLTVEEAEALMNVKERQSV